MGPHHQCCLGIEYAKGTATAASEMSRAVDNQTLVEEINVVLFCLKNYSDNRSKAA